MEEPQLQSAISRFFRTRYKMASSECEYFTPVLARFNKLTVLHDMYMIGWPFAFVCFTDDFAYSYRLYYVRHCHSFKNLR